MKTVILAGGFGTRFSEETFIRPKPLIEIGGLPIICHLMDIYSMQGFNEFILCLGYKSEDVKNWFLNYYASLSDFSLDFRDARKFAGGHEYSPTREKLESALISSIAQVLSINVKIVEL